MKLWDWSSAVRGFIVGANVAMVYVLLQCPFVIENHRLWERSIGIAFYTLFTVYVILNEVLEERKEIKNAHI